MESSGTKATTPTDMKKDEVVIEGQINVLGLN
jgi:hypothetical protein